MGWVGLEQSAKGLGWIACYTKWTHGQLRDGHDYHNTSHGPSRKRSNLTRRTSHCYYTLRVKQTQFKHSTEKNNTSKFTHSCLSAYVLAYICTRMKNPLYDTIRYFTSLITTCSGGSIDFEKTYYRFGASPSLASSPENRRLRVKPTDA